MKWTWEDTEQDVDHALAKAGGKIDKARLYLEHHRACRTAEAIRDTAEAINGLLYGLKYGKAEGMSIAEAIEVGAKTISESIGMAGGGLERSRAADRRGPRLRRQPRQLEPVRAGHSHAARRGRPAALFSFDSLDFI